ncbi:Highly reducing polyketide synthase alnA [Trichinella spiralis]|uniref:Highly reducing polyketide synthase alnA n=1 Tax=Trichinella spiralis TaxID=6334 RepID=A0ABR3KVD9_TRISP
MLRNCCIDASQRRLGGVGGGNMCAETEHRPPGSAGAGRGTVIPGTGAGRRRGGARIRGTAVIALGQRQFGHTADVVVKAATPQVRFAAFFQILAHPRRAVDLANRLRHRRWHRMDNCPRFAGQILSSR